MYTRTICAIGAILLLIAAVNASPAYAQATATILGTVMDPSGAVIGGAMVQLKNTGTSLTQNTISDEQGRYRFPDLAIGEYEVQASSPGFQTVVHKSINLTVGASPVVDFKLPLGQVGDTVLVAAEVSQVETQSTGFGALVESKQITELPLNGRNFTQLLTLAPGVAPARPSTATARNIRSPERVLQARPIFSTIRTW